MESGWLGADSILGRPKNCNHPLGPEFEPGSYKAYPRIGARVNESERKMLCLNNIWTSGHNMLVHMWYNNKIWGFYGILTPKLIQHPGTLRTNFLLKYNISLFYPEEIYFFHINKCKKCFLWRAAITEKIVQKMQKDVPHLDNFAHVLICI